jgi:hypothetical protein
VPVRGFAVEADPRVEELRAPVVRLVADDFWPSAAVAGVRLAVAGRFAGGFRWAGADGAESGAVAGSEVSSEGPVTLQR